MADWAMIVANQRSGTHLTRELLDQSDRIEVLGEVFHPARLHIEHRSYWGHLVKLVRDRPRMSVPDRRLDVFESFLAAAVDAFGDRRFVLDVKYNSLHNLDGPWHAPRRKPRLLEVAADQDVAVIHLVRSNLLKRHVSSRLAAMNDTYRTTDPDALEVTTLTLTPEVLVPTLREQQRQMELVRGWLGPRALEVAYEDLWTADTGVDRAVLDRLCAHVGIEPVASLEVEVAKQTHDDLRHVIENYDEIAEHLATTEFAHLVAPG